MGSWGRTNRAVVADPMTAGRTSANPVNRTGARPNLERVRTRHFQTAKETRDQDHRPDQLRPADRAIFDEAGIDFLLVGDSAGNNVLGFDTTLPVTIDELIPLTRAVAAR